MKSRSIFLAAVALAGITAAVAIMRHNARTPDHPLAAEKISTVEIGGHPVEKWELTGADGTRFPVRMIRPQGVTRAPCVVFLYGIGQDARFFDLIAPVFAEHGIAMAMPEQFDCGERRIAGAGPLRRALALRERCGKIVPETRRVVDFLSGQPGIDPDRLWFVGASFGGITGCSLLATEPRLTKAVLVMTGGNLPQLLDGLARAQWPDSRVLAPAAARLAAWIFKSFEPLDALDATSPRPLLFLNVRADELIPRACMEILYQRAKNPKKEILYDGPHDRISEDTARRMLEDALPWLKAPLENPLSH